MPTQVEMRAKLCPFMSSAGVMIKCAGDRCIAFNSHHTYEYLGEDGSLQPFSNKVRYFERDDDSTELETLLAQGWKKTQRAGSPKTSLRREVEAQCWCDAMPANMECLGGGQ